MKSEESLVFNLFTQPMFVAFKRIIKAGWISFVRSLGLNIATLFIMVMVIFLITFLAILNPASKALIASIQEKIDISVYFKADTSPEDILNFKTQLAQVPEVKSVEYVSRERALENFMNLHQDDQVLIDSLKEIGENPFLSALNVQTWQPSQYEQVAQFIQNSSARDLVDNVDFRQRKSVIDKVNVLTSGVSQGAIFLSIIFGVIAVLVAFNTVRIAIYNSSEEIATMRLVGASNWFIRGPFLIQGIVVGFFAAVLTLLITLGTAYGLDAKISAIAPEVSIFQLFLANFWYLFLVQFATGVGLGFLSSIVAIRRYLRI